MLWNTEGMHTAKVNFPLWRIIFSPLFFGSFMSECFFLCWSHVGGSSKALFYFKSCSRQDSFLFGLLWRYKWVSCFVAARRFNSVSTLRWSDFQLQYVWWLQGWSGTENIWPITTNTHKYILCPVHPWIILVFSSIFTFSISMHWTCFTPGLSSITSGL